MDVTGLIGRRATLTLVREDEETPASKVDGTIVGIVSVDGVARLVFLSDDGRIKTGYGFGRYTVHAA